MSASLANTKAGLAIRQSRDFKDSLVPSLLRCRPAFIAA
jgi:hypothetical protein